MNNQDHINDPVNQPIEPENKRELFSTNPLNPEAGNTIPDASPDYYAPVPPARVTQPTNGEPVAAQPPFNEPAEVPFNEPFFSASEQRFNPADMSTPRYREAAPPGPEYNPYYQAQNFTANGEPPHERKSKAKIWLAFGLIALLLFSSILAIQAAFRSKSSSKDVPTLPAPRVTNAAAPSPTELSNSFREISKAVKPTVVYISITETSSSEGSPFDQFGLGGPLQRRRQQATGSGFIVTNDGYILTNNHVVANAEKIEVTLSDNRKYKGKVIGTDPETDLAVIKIDETGLPVAVLGNSDEVQQGDWVLALGSPFGLQQTLTAGIVSATGREFGGGSSAPLGKYIQTDASINPGNSGGPLINMNAEVIGINSFIISQQAGYGQGGSLGIGFAVTSNVARNVFNELVKKGKVTYGYLGVLIGNVDESVARSYGVQPNTGAFVTQEPTPNSPAAKAGLKFGDIITSFDGKKVTSSRELTDAVTNTPVGKSCEVEFIRDGHKQSITVQVAERPANLSARNIQPNQPPGEPQNTASKLGVTVQTVTPQMSDRLRIKGGAFVKATVPGSPAESEGINHGDVIHRVNQTPINSAEDLIEVEKGLKSGDDVTLMIERNGQISFLTLTIE